MQHVISFVDIKFNFCYFALYFINYKAVFSNIHYSKNTDDKIGKLKFSKKQTILIIIAAAFLNLLDLIYSDNYCYYNDTYKIKIVLLSTFLLMTIAYNFHYLIVLRKNQ